MLSIAQETTCQDSFSSAGYPSLSPCQRAMYRRGACTSAGLATLGSSFALFPIFPCLIRQLPSSAYRLLVFACLLAVGGCVATCAVTLAVSVYGMVNGSISVSSLGLITYSSQSQPGHGGRGREAAGPSRELPSQTCQLCTCHLGWCLPHGRCGLGYRYLVALSELGVGRRPETTSAGKTKAMVGSIWQQEA